MRAGAWATGARPDSNRASAKRWSGSLVRPRAGYASSKAAAKPPSKTSTAPHSTARSIRPQDTSCRCRAPSETRPRDHSERGVRGQIVLTAYFEDLQIDQRILVGTWSVCKEEAV